MHETMGGYGYGYSLDTMLAGLLVLLAKLLIVVLVVAVIVGIVMWVKNTFFKDAANNQIVKAINADPALKTVGGIALAIVVILLAVSLLQGMANPGYGVNMGYGFNNPMNGYNGMGGYNLGFGISGLLSFLSNILMFVLVISLVMAIGTYLKQQFDKGAFGVQSQNTSGNKGSNDQQASIVNVEPTNNQNQ